MRVLFVLLLSFSAFCGSAVSFGADRFVSVRWVDDGDTIVLSDGTRVRYCGINAPEVAHDREPAEPFGPEAGEVNEELVHRKKVRLEFDQERTDQYGRLLAYVFLEDGTFVNGALVSSGHAHVVFRRPNTRYDSKLLALQREAMRKGAGMWKIVLEQSGPFLGNRRSKRFHRTDCPFGNQMRPENRKVFTTKYDAFWAGFSPCKKCF
jgi:micrococcal nuclease